MYALARRNEALRNDEHWAPPPFADLTTLRGKLISRIRRVLDLQAASIWRDLKSPLSEATGTVLDVGAGAQPYRPLINPDATYGAIDIADARERFGYDMPGTVYFSGNDWPVADHTIDVLLATETLERCRSRRLSGPSPARATRRRPTHPHCPFCRALALHSP